MSDRRLRLLRLSSDIDQQIAEAQAICTGTPTHNTLHKRAALQLSALRRLRSDVQQKLSRGDK
jgi:hypothetical protein